MSLHITAITGDVDCSNVLLDSGANINISNTNKETALHIAIKQDHIAFAEMLIKRGTDVNATDRV